MEGIRIPKKLMGLAEVEGISVSDGLYYCGSVRDFEEFLQSFYIDLESRSADIEDAYKRGDIPYFVIKVHALKSSARVIGATELADLAYKLELAGKAGDTKVIDDNVEALLSFYRSYKGRLESYMQDKKLGSPAKKSSVKESTKDNPELDLKKKILVVDDDPNYISLVRSWLVDDYKVSMVTNGERALKLLGMNKVDLILLDYEMPGMSGPQVLETLRKDEKLKDIPVIILTGNDNEESAKALEALKPQGYFLKTMPKDEIMNKIKIFFMQEEA